MKENELRPVKSYEAKALLMAAARGASLVQGFDPVKLQSEVETLRSMLATATEEIDKVKGQLKAKDTKLRACRKELREME